MPHAESTFTIVVSPASNNFMISSWTFLSSSVGSPTLTNVGRFKSSFVVPSSNNKLTSPLSGSAFSNWYSVFFTNGTLKLLHQLKRKRRRRLKRLLKRRKRKRLQLRRKRKI